MNDELERINKQLADRFGIDTVTGRVMYRVVWAEDQFENRLTDYDDKGNPLLIPEIRLLPKYQWIKGKYILENLMYITNSESQKELAGEKLSYEVIFTFDDKNGNPLPPVFDVCVLVITTMQAAMKGGGYVKYKEGEPLEERKKEVEALQMELFGNESDTTDALAHGSGIVVPNKYEVH